MAFFTIAQPFFLPFGVHLSHVISVFVFGLQVCSFRAIVVTYDS